MNPRKLEHGFRMMRDGIPYTRVLGRVSREGLPGNTLTKYYGWNLIECFGFRT